MFQGRSPTLDLDSLYGAGPSDPVSAKFYADDRHLLMGKTVRVGRFRPRVGFDLPGGATTLTEIGARSFPTDATTRIWPSLRPTWP